MYVHQNRSLVENTSKIEHLIPKKRPGRKGVESGMHSGECMKRHLVLDKKDSCWIWPDNEISNDDRRELLAISIEISIKFFFKNFMYNFWWRGPSSRGWRPNRGPAYYGCSPPSPPRME